MNCKSGESFKSSFSSSAIDEIASILTIFLFNLSYATSFPLRPLRNCVDWMKNEGCWWSRTCTYRVWIWRKLGNLQGRAINKIEPGSLKQSMKLLEKCIFMEISACKFVLTKESWGSFTIQGAAFKYLAWIFIMKGFSNLPAGFSSDQSTHSRLHQHQNYYFFTNTVRTLWEFSRFSR